MICSHGHNQEINETRKRSIVKSLSFHIVQMVVDAIILLTMIRADFPPEVIAGAGAVIVEVVCFGGYYLWERLWNRIKWGREIKSIKKC